MELFGTLGPACGDRKILESMFRQGMTGLRLNLSHITLPQAEEQIKQMRAAAANCGVQPKLLIDMQGPELRIGALREPFVLREGETIPFGDGGIPLPPVILDAVTVGQELLLDDGKLLLRTESRAQARVLRGGLLQSRKSIALPGCEIRLPALTEQDRDNIRLAAAYGVTGLMQPFVRDQNDLKEVRAALNAAGGEHIRLFAKIENKIGIEHLGELLPAADEIVIARGDLGNAVTLPALPGVQKQIATACRHAGKPFMVVTQMLASMEHSAVPTRAEVSDIFNAVLDGASSLMLTGETAQGDYPVEAVGVLADTVHAAEAYVGLSMMCYNVRKRRKSLFR